MVNNFKNMAKGMIGGMVNPYPNMYLRGFDDINDYGLNRYTLENGLRNNYGQLLDMLSRNQSLSDALQRIKDNNNLRMIQNEMRYNPEFFSRYTGL